MTRESKIDERPAPAPRSNGLWARLKARFGRSHRTAADEPGDRTAGDAERLAQTGARSMMGNLLEFADTRIEDVMVARAEVVAIEESSTLQALMQRFAEANHSRLPVYRETLDDLTGMIHIKDFVNLVVKFSTQKSRRRSAKNADAEPAAAPPAAFRASDLKKTVKQSGLVRELLFVPPSMRASDLLVKMQATHMHMAAVVDEYGGTDGLVTIEDLVEIIVGDIADEHDTTEGMIRDAGNQTYIADARVPIDEVETLLGIDLLPAEEEESADTLGGLIFAMIGRVPSRGEIVRHSSGLEFEVAESDPRRVKKIRIHLRQAQVGPAAGPPSG
ncbi:MAG TPA: hemolysin family protein [Aestuariivirgaceae bacterium]|nr:hemolysin family protein [Aestuariivirgaceae bacterium]